MLYPEKCYFSYTLYQEQEQLRSGVVKNYKMTSSGGKINNLIQFKGPAYTYLKMTFDENIFFSFNKNLT